MSGPPESGDDEARRRNRANFAAAVAVLLLIAGAYWLLTALEEHQRIEDCLASGRRDCTQPIEQSSGPRG